MGFLKRILIQNLERGENELELSFARWANGNLWRDCDEAIRNEWQKSLHTANRRAFCAKPIAALTLYARDCYGRGLCDMDGDRSWRRRSGGDFVF